MMSSTDPMRPEGELRVTLPWPSPSLSPNARLHWSRKAPMVRTARKAAWALTLEAGARQMSVSSNPCLAVEFCPPDKRRRDLDNLIASMKAANDGIADALGIDDSKFQTTYRMGEPVKGGAVHVTIQRAA